MEEKVVRKKALQESQGGFRKGRGTIDNIFSLNHIVQREKCKGEKVYALFVDLKAAFDNVDRRKLWRILRDKEIEEQLIRKIRSVFSYQEFLGSLNLKSDFKNSKWRIQYGGRIFEK